LQPGDMLDRGKYRIIRQLGRGGFGADESGGQLPQGEDARRVCLEHEGVVLPVGARQEADPLQLLVILPRHVELGYRKDGELQLAVRLQQGNVKEQEGFLKQERARQEEIRAMKHVRVDWIHSTGALVLVPEGQLRTT